MSNKRPEELFPNLFAKKPAKPVARDMNPADMRLLQWSMRSASKRSAMAGQRTR